MDQINTQQTQIAERARQLLRYDPLTGMFTWGAKVAKKIVVGNEAGYRRPDGQLIIKFDGARYRAYRLAFLLMTDAWPLGEVDHIDGDRTNNRWSNLRDVSRAVNQQNIRKPLSSSKLGVLGVSFTGFGYYARIYTGGKLRRLGTYRTPEQAHQAYVIAKRQLHEGNTL